MRNGIEDAELRNAGGIAPQSSVAPGRITHLCT